MRNSRRNEGAFQPNMFPDDMPPYRELLEQHTNSVERTQTGADNATPAEDRSLTDVKQSRPIMVHAAVDDLDVHLPGKSL